MSRVRHLFKAVDTHGEAVLYNGGTRYTPDTAAGELYQVPLKSNLVKYVI